MALALNFFIFSILLTLRFWNIFSIYSMFVSSVMAYLVWSFNKSKWLREVLVKKENTSLLLIWYWEKYPSALLLIWAYKSSISFGRKLFQHRTQNILCNVRISTLESIFIIKSHFYIHGIPNSIKNKTILWLYDKLFCPLIDGCHISYLL